MPARALSVRSMVNLGMSLLSLDEDEDLVAGDEGVAGFPLELAEGGRCAFGEVEGRLVGGGRPVAGAEQAEVGCRAELEQAGDGAGSDVGDAEAVAVGAAGDGVDVDADGVGGREVAAGVLDPDAAYVRGLGAEGGALGWLREEAGEVGD